MRVLVSLPNTGWIHREVVKVLLQLYKDGRHELRITMPSEKPFENNLHHIRNDFVEGGEDYWLNIDSDNPPLRNPLDLIEYDRDIIGLPTPVWGTGKTPDENPYMLNAYQYVKDDDAYTEYPKKDGLREVDAVGFGTVIFAKRVFENKEMLKDCFTRKTNEDGTVRRGTDIAFCERSREQGFKVYTHYGYVCTHFKETDMVERINQFKQQYVSSSRNGEEWNEQGGESLK